MTVCRPYVVGMGLWLATAMAASEQARAQSWNLYDNSATTYQVSFHGGAMGPNQAGTINILLPGGTIDASKIAPVTMDTGSTGIVVGKDHFDITGRTALGTGSQAYGSSGVSHTGTYYTATVEIYSASPTSGAPPVATATTVRVLYVDDPTAFYMGVGFNRGNGAATPTMIPVSANPFLNIDGVTTKGYVISNTGVTLGIPGSANSGFAMVKLEPNTIDWNVATGTVSIGGISGYGTILQDAGIKYAFLTPPSGTDLRDGVHVRENVDMSVSFPGGFAS